jgi:hypothetical protein
MNCPCEFGASGAHEAGCTFYRLAELCHERFNPQNGRSPVVLPDFTRNDLAAWLGASGLRRGAEIGVAQGKYSVVLCEHIPDVDLLCVDPWLQYPENPRGGPQEQHDRNFELLQQRLAPYRWRPAKAFSMDAVKDVPLESLDFVYIDGHHSFDYVMQDLIEWGKRVRIGGVIAGHDYYMFRWAGVVEAVRAYVAGHHVKEWFLTKGIRRADHSEPSFFWVKTAERHPSFDKYNVWE